MEKAEVIAGEWFRLKPGKYPPKYRILYRFKRLLPTGGREDQGYLVELGDSSEQTYHHCEVMSVTDTHINVYGFLLGEMIERSLPLEGFELVRSKEIFKKD